jgi:hypothetical protein
VSALSDYQGRYRTSPSNDGFFETMKPDIYEFWIRTRTDGLRLLRAFLDIEVPVISVRDLDPASGTVAPDNRPLPFSACSLRRASECQAGWPGTN